MKLVNKCTSPIASLEAYYNETESTVYLTIKKLGFNLFKSNINLITNKSQFDKFLEKINKALHTRGLPNNYVVAELTSYNQEVIARVYKCHSDTFDVSLYSNFRKPLGCINNINLTHVDLSTFVNIL